MTRLAVCFSRGIRSIRHIERFVAVDRLILPSEKWTEEDDVNVLVWGRKENSLEALEFASTHELNVLYLEDGFIRTASDDSHSRMSYSLVVDKKGVYYDATVSSDLELFLNGSDAEVDRAMLDAGRELIQACMETVIEHNITKYNYCTDYSLDDSVSVGGHSHKQVLVVDQTFGDSSVVYGGMDQSSFESMLNAAIDENPGADIMVKTHPDVISGRSKGYLADYARKRGVTVFSRAVNSMSLLKTVDRVYTGTSQMGMEALLCNKPVSVFGRPFYAGWGLTDDRVTLPGRTTKRTLLELFYAAYMRYPRYLNPITGKSWTLPECLEHVLLQKRVHLQNAQDFLCTGITPWKRRYIEKYLRSPAGSVRFCAPARIQQHLSKNKCDAIATWGYRVACLRNPADKTTANRILRIEDGFLRSSGLGSDFTAPSSLVMDSSGLYFNATGPSDLENLLNTYDCTLDDVLRARRLISLIISAKLSKYNVGGGSDVGTQLPVRLQKILVVGQVENDASLALGCQDTSSNEQLLQAVRKHNPGAWIAYKPHPDVVAGNRPGVVNEAVTSAIVDHVCGDDSIIECLDLCDELHTMTSLSGFEALLRGKKVVTYGKPFYAGWGLTTDLQELVTRNRQRTLEELVYCALIVYPRYMDIDTGEFASPEDIICKITNNQMINSKKQHWSKRQMLKVVNVYKGLSYAP